MGWIKKTGMLLAVAFCLSANHAGAQSVAQLLEQLTLDMQKLSQLKATLQEMYKGYIQLDKDYSNIRDIVQGNFDLHKAFLDGLLAVSPTVRQYHKVASVMDKERSLVTEYQAASRRWTSSGLFSPGELDHFRQLYGTVSDRGSKCLDRLLMVITAGQLRMSDAERMQAIDRIDADVGGLLQGLRQFNDALSVQALQRAREQNNINSLKSMYGNNP
ncbi:TerB family tellurite resistance protein [Flavitalea sp. BT771]|uniref:TerB family tellurite resistance protein n=1 Tax=Flavitalea sp. BT771 TaxID=3063329 RepID=UPI0026E2D5DF|nr:TerB family tellurite resistance protein [Flavitalea sp. BT771]MDO6433281.1 TerB family tellurite resistance protein [Flavitalea sp. BT771]MDV6222814.1 TerB family tellurite resistance protein [Flavitalea sp. BT771]